MKDPFDNFHSALVPNGLSVYATQMDRPWQIMGFTVHSGAEQDPVEREGLGHYVEHLVSKNAGIAYKDLIAFFEDCGGVAELGTTGHKSVDYYFRVPADKYFLTRAISLFGNMLLCAKLDKFVERERGVITEEFRRRWNMPFRMDLRKREQRALYAGYWLERFLSPMGSLESIQRISQADLQNHYDTHYTPPNISVVGVGPFDVGKLATLLSDSCFAKEKPGKRTPIPQRLAVVNAPGENRNVFEYSSQGIPAQAPSYHSGAKLPGQISFATMRIVKNMLDEVLDDQIRQREDRAWTYHVGCDMYDFRYFWEFNINCSAFSLEAIDQIEAVVEECIDSLAQKEDLFLQEKHRAIARVYMLDNTGGNFCSGAIHDLVDEGRIVSRWEYKKDLEALSMEDIRKVLYWLRPEQRCTLIMKP